MIRHLAAALLVAVQLIALRADQDSSIISGTGDRSARVLAASLQSDDLADARINSALMRELRAGIFNFSQRKVLAYELLRRRNSLSSSQIAALQSMLATIYGTASETPDVLGLSGERMARQLLEHENGSLIPGLSQTADWGGLGLDEDLLNGQLFVPVTVDRFENYISKEASPSRYSIYMATFMLTEQAMSTSQGSGSLPTAEQVPEPTLEQIASARRVLSEPNAVDNQIAYLLKNIVDTGRKRLRLRVSGAGEQVAALAHEHSLNTISQAKCGQSEVMRTLGGEVVSLNRSESNSVKKLLRIAGILSPVISSVGCSRSSLVVNGTNGITGVGYMAVFSPDRKSNNAGVLFSGFEENFWIEEVGAKGRRGVYLARTVAGSGGYLNAHLIDANTGHELFAVDMLPDGELLTLLPGASSPQYLVLRQSVTTVEGTGCNACDKNTLTAIFALGKADRYELLNIKISRSVKELNRIWSLHRAQLPSAIARATCMGSRLSEADCLNSLQAASIEATARIDISDVQGAIRVLDSANRRLWSTLSTSSTELDRATLTQSFLQEAAARLMDGQTRETIEMCKALTSSDLFKSLIIEVRDIVELACDNMSGMAYNEQGNPVLAAERFTHAFARHSDDPVLIGNLARIVLDQAGRRNAAAMLVQELFRQSGGPVFTHHQDMAIGESTVYMHKTWESLLFLFPEENLKQSTVGLNLWKGGEIASLSGLKDLPTLLLDESMHYLDQQSLLSIGPSILLTYARELGNDGNKASAKDILGRLATSDVSHEVRAQALDMLARAANEAGDEVLAFRLSDRSVDSLRLRATSRTSGRFTSSMMGAHRYIVENWFQLARKRGVNPAALYEEAARWKFDRAIGAPDVENSIRGRLEAGEMRLEYLVVGEEVWRFLLVGSDVSLFILPISSAELSRRVLELTQALSEASTRVVDADRVVLEKQLTKLSSVLLGGLKIGGVKKLFIGSDTGLTGFP